MKDRIERISGVSKVSRVKGINSCSPEEIAAKIKEAEQAAADRAELRAYLAQFPNPDHLSFAELLAQAIKNNKASEEDIAYILDIKSSGPK